MNSVSSGPDQWAEVELGSICSFVYGKSLPSDVRSGTGYAVYGSNGKVGMHSESLTNGATIVVGRKGSFGEVHYSSEPCWPIDTTYFITADRTNADMRWLYWRLKGLGLNTLNRAAAIPGLNREDAYRQKLLVPPLAEQKRIAAILDAADALRAKRRESIAQLDKLLQATFLEMFGDPVTNPKGWKSVRMGDIMRIRRGGSPRPIEKYLGGTINWIKISDATSSENDLYITSCAEKISEEGLNKTTLLEPSSFVFANSGVSLGFARILKIAGAIHDGWLAFDRFDRNVLNDLFFLKALNSVTEYFRRTAPAGTQPNLNTAIMKSFNLILPPIDMQREFAAIVESVESQKSRLRRYLEGLDDLFASLQSRAFKGEL